MLLPLLFIFNLFVVSGTLASEDIAPPFNRQRFEIRVRTCSSMLKVEMKGAYDAAFRYLFSDFSTACSSDDLGAFGEADCEKMNFFLRRAAQEDLAGLEDFCFKYVTCSREELLADLLPGMVSVIRIKPLAFFQSLSRPWDANREGFAGRFFWILRELAASYLATLAGEDVDANAYVVRSLVRGLKELGGSAGLIAHLGGAGSHSTMDVASDLFLGCVKSLSLLSDRGGAHDAPAFWADAVWLIDALRDASLQVIQGSIQADVADRLGMRARGDGDFHDDDDTMDEYINTWAKACEQLYGLPANSLVTLEPQPKNGINALVAAPPAASGCASGAGGDEDGCGPSDLKRARIG